MENYYEVDKIVTEISQDTAQRRKDATHGSFCKVGFNKFQIYVEQILAFMFHSEVRIFGRELTRQHFFSSVKR